MVWVPFRIQNVAALPDNPATEGIAEAIALGAREGGGAGSAVLMVVQPGERNSYDQQVRGLESGHAAEPIPTVRAKPCALGVVASGTEMRTASTNRTWPCSHSQVLRRCV